MLITGRSSMLAAMAAAIFGGSDRVLNALSGREPPPGLQAPAREDLSSDRDRPKHPRQKGKSSRARNFDNHAHTPNTSHARVTDGTRHHSRKAYREESFSIMFVSLYGAVKHALNSPETCDAFLAAMTQKMGPELTEEKIRFIARNSDNHRTTAAEVRTVRDALQNLGLLVPLLDDRALWLKGRLTAVPTHYFTAPARKTRFSNGAATRKMIAEAMDEIYAERDTDQRNAEEMAFSPLEV